MAEIKLHEVLIDRTWIGVLQDYFNMKNIKEYRTLRNDHGELTAYEKIYNRTLTRMDAIVISPLTKDEIDEITNGYYENKELQAYQEKESEERLKLYYENYGKDA